MAQKNDQGTAVWVNPGGTASFSYGGGGLTGIGAVYAMANPKGPGGQVMTTSQGLEGTNEAGGSTTSGSMSEPVPASAHVPPDASNLIHENLGSGSHPPSVSFPAAAVIPLSRYQTAPGRTVWRRSCPPGRYGTVTVTGQRGPAMPRATLLVSSHPASNRLDDTKSQNQGMPVPAHGTWFPAPIFGRINGSHSLGEPDHDR